MGEHGSTAPVTTASETGRLGAESPPPRLLVAAGLVWIGERLLVQRRPPGAAHGAGMLELPGGKIERGEEPRRALARELCEEWGPRAGQLTVGPVVEVLHHVYPSPGPEVVLIVFAVDGRGWAGGRWRHEITAEAGVEVLAFDCERLPVDQFLAADRPFIEGVQRGRHGPNPRPAQHAQPDQRGEGRRGEAPC